MTCMNFTAFSGSFSTFALMVFFGILAVLLDRAVFGMKKLGVDPSLQKMLRVTCLAIAGVDCLFVLGMAVTHLVHCFKVI